MTHPIISYTLSPGSDPITQAKTRSASMPLTTKEEEFQNPTGNWEYEGGYIVELTKEASEYARHISPDHMKGNELHVPHGHLRYTFRGIQMFGLPNNKDPFAFGYKSIVCIRRADRTLLWRSHNLQ